MRVVRRVASAYRLQATVPGLLRPHASRRSLGGRRRRSRAAAFACRERRSAMPRRSSSCLKVVLPSEHGGSRLQRVVIVPSEAAVAKRLGNCGRCLPQAASYLCSLVRDCQTRDIRRDIQVTH
jgi:hypothetical protein